MVGEREEFHLAKFYGTFNLCLIYVSLWYIF